MTRKKTKKKTGFFGMIRRVFYGGITLGIVATIALALYVGYIAIKMQQASDWSIPDRPPNVRIIDQNGTLIANRGTTGGEAVGLHEISPWVAKAVLAIEDRRFYSHWGVDPIGIGRAVLNNLRGRGGMQGGSTLTQQLAKNLFLKPDRTLERKVQEALLALWIEHKYSKDQILEMYLNRVYLGAGTYGIEAAAQRYFNKNAKDLSLLESATIAGLLKAPSRLSPSRNPEGAHQRALIVLSAMHEENMITDKQWTEAKNAPLPKTAAFWAGSENYVADYVVTQLPFLIGETDRDLIVETSLDMNLQKAAEKALQVQITAQGKARKVEQAALVSIDANGAIRAVVGGVDYAASQFNRAIDAKRQPGSTFKPFVYLAALEAGRTPNSIRNDAPVKIGKWTPRNYGGKYMGEVTLATALSHSLNSVAAQLIMEVGTDSVIAVAHRLGIHSALNDNASIALGTSEVSLLELTGAFVPFANGGMRPQIRLITRITDTDGKVLYDYGTPTADRVINPQVVAMMNAMLEETVKSGTAKKADINRPTAGKTGTSQDFRDAWFIGYTADYVTGIWFGNDDGQSMKNVTGGSLPVAAWKAYMQIAEKGLPVRALTDQYQLENMVPGGSDLLPDSNAPSPYPTVDPTDINAYPAAPAPYPNETAEPVIAAPEHDGPMDHEMPQPDDGIEQAIRGALDNNNATTTPQDQDSAQDSAIGDNPADHMPAIEENGAIDTPPMQPQDPLLNAPQSDMPPAAMPEQDNHPGNDNFVPRPKVGVGLY